MDSTKAAEAAASNLQAQEANKLRTRYWQSLTPLVNVKTGEKIPGFPLHAFRIRYLNEEQLLAIEWELGVNVQFIKPPLTLRGRQDRLLDLLGFGGSRTYL